MCYFIIRTEYEYYKASSYCFFWFSSISASSGNGRGVMLSIKTYLPVFGTSSQAVRRMWNPLSADSGWGFPPLSLAVFVAALRNMSQAYSLNVCAGSGGKTRFKSGCLRENPNLDIFWPLTFLTLNNCYNVIIIENFLKNSTFFKKEANYYEIVTKICSISEISVQYYNQNRI